MCRKPSGFEREPVDHEHTCHSCGTKRTTTHLEDGRSFASRIEFPTHNFTDVPDVRLYGCGPLVWTDPYFPILVTAWVIYEYWPSGICRECEKFVAEMWRTDLGPYRYKAMLYNRYALGGLDPIGSLVLMEHDFKAITDGEYEKILTESNPAFVNMNAERVRKHKETFNV